MSKRSRPSVKEMWWCAGLLAVWLFITAIFIGLRPEHPVLATVVFLLFFFTAPSRRLMVALLPFLLFGISYDWMNILPNYKVNPVDVEGLYNAEKALFGIKAGSDTLTPNEYFALHTVGWMDFLSGLFYLCWVPLPIIYGLWLYFTRKATPYLHFSIVFLFVNLLGFAIYYIHPAAPPWYVAQHGMTAIEGTPGSVAGLGAFDQMTGLGIFHALYARNANVFAAVPSLHSAYTLIAFVYAVKYRSPAIWQWTLGIVTVGIWFTAVYTSHHYLIDVLCGIATALVGILIFECVLMRFGGFRNFMKKYANYIQPVK